MDQSDSDSDSRGHGQPRRSTAHNLSVAVRAMAQADLPPENNLAWAHAIGKVADIELLREQQRHDNRRRRRRRKRKRGTDGDPRPQEAQDGEEEQEEEQQQPESGGAAEDTTRTRSRGDSSSSAQETHCCIICMEVEASILVYPCRHLCMCPACNEELAMHAQFQCPVCRANIQGTTKVFRP